MSTIPEPTMTYTTPESRWRAVRDRDHSAIGHFILGVKTTGIYCRPGCPARTPNRENVLFFDSIIEAAAAGFRPCKRCRPNDLAEITRYASLVQDACTAIERADRVLTLEELATDAGLSKHHFHRIFKSVTGLTPGQFSRAHRAQRTRSELRASHSVTDAMYAAGFQSSGRFYASASSILGMTPATFREGGTGEDIQFAIAATSLGLALVAATRKGVCSIAFNDDADELVAHLVQQFPEANITDADEGFVTLVTDVIASIEQPEIQRDIPVDLRGTAFQHRVWNALRSIPIGETRDYTEVADYIGSPTSVRAVASACARNNVAVVIPCHRVVRKDGSLAGYRWGTDRKEALLSRERRGR